MLGDAVGSARDREAYARGGRHFLSQPTRWLSSAQNQTGDQTPAFIGETRVDWSSLIEHKRRYLACDRILWNQGRLASKRPVASGPTGRHCSLLRDGAFHLSQGGTRAVGRSRPTSGAAQTRTSPSTPSFADSEDPSETSNSIVTGGAPCVVDHFKSPGGGLGQSTRRRRRRRRHARSPPAPRPRPQVRPS